MSHDHHHHHPVSYNKAFAIGIALNITFVFVEAWYGYVSESLALLADAGHNLSDVLSLVLAWGANYLAAKPPHSKRTYGLRKVTVFASLISSLMLLFALGAIAYEALLRFINPSQPNGSIIIVVAFIGVIINTVTALLFVKDQHRDLNIRAAYLHMAADAAVSLGVVIAGIAILYSGWLWLDPLISLLIVAVILVGTWHLLRESIAYSLDFVPSSVDAAAIEKFLLEQSNVVSLHDLHIWALSTTDVALTVHLTINDSKINNDFVARIQAELREKHAIQHATIQLESVLEAESCLLAKSCEFH
jgi:cobalt-zinc-cadmium efflux system protein